MRTLAARLARGEDSAFAELYDACADRLYRFAMLRLGSSEDAADIVQTVFLRAVRKRRRFRRVQFPTAYVFRIARNELARMMKKRMRKEQSLPSDAEAAGRNMEDGEELAREALARLGPAERELVELKLYAGLTFQEIAIATSQPMGTVATKYRRALESLRPWLEKQYR